MLDRQRSRGRRTGDILIEAMDGAELQVGGATAVARSSPLDVSGRHRGLCGAARRTSCLSSVRTSRMRSFGSLTSSSPPSSPSSASNASTNESTESSTDLPKPTKQTGTRETQSRVCETFAARLLHRLLHIQPQYVFHIQSQYFHNHYSVECAAAARRTYIRTIAGRRAPTRKHTNTSASRRRQRGRPTSNGREAGEVGPPRPHATSRCRHAWPNVGLSRETSHKSGRALPAGVAPDRSARRRVRPLVRRPKRIKLKTQKD